jgi:hypothetical protein
MQAVSHHITSQTMDSLGTHHVGNKTRSTASLASYSWLQRVAVGRFEVDVESGVNLDNNLPACSKGGRVSNQQPKHNPTSNNPSCLPASALGIATRKQHRCLDDHGTRPWLNQ